MFKFAKGSKNRRRKGNGVKTHLGEIRQTSPESNPKTSHRKKILSSRRYLLSSKDNKKRISRIKKSAYYGTKAIASPIGLREGLSLQDLEAHPRAGAEAIQRFVKIVKKMIKAKKSTMNMDLKVVAKQEVWFKGVQRAASTVEEKKPFFRPIRREFWFIEIWDFYIMIIFLLEICNFAYK